MNMGMGLVNAQLFIGTRCRLCRHRDAKFVNGWIQFFRDESLVIATDDFQGSEPGDDFFIEAYGPKIKGSVNATATSITRGQEAEGTTRAQLSLRLKEPIRISEHTEASRQLVTGMSADVKFEAVELTAKVRDVSLAGVGLVCEQSVAPGTELTLAIGTPVGTITANGIVRHVREVNGAFRVGVELVELSRLDGSRWRKLMGEAA